MMTMRKKWITIIASIIIFFVAFSRIYLGVHFILDIIGGFLVGLAVALCFYYLETKIRISLKFYQKILFCIFIPLVMLAVLMNDTTIQLCSMLFGLTIGYILENKTVNIQTSVKNKTKISRGIIGLVVVLVAFLLLGILPSYLEFIRFILVGLTITFFAPVVFSKTDKIFKWGYGVSNIINIFWYSLFNYHFIPDSINRVSSFYFLNSYFTEKPKAFPEILGKRFQRFP